MRASAAVAAAMIVAFAIVTALGHVRQQRQLARALDRPGDLALVAAAGAGDAPRADLAAVGDQPAQRADVLVVDLVDLVAAVRTGLAPAAAGTALAVAATHLATVALLGHARSKAPGFPTSAGDRSPARERESLARAGSRAAPDASAKTHAQCCVFVVAPPRLALGSKEISKSSCGRAKAV